MSLNYLKAKHLSDADLRWKAAVIGAQRAMLDDGRQYKPAYVEGAVLARELARRLLEASGSTLFSVLGLDGRNDLDGYSEYAFGGVCTLLEFVDHFINHEIMGDGDPGVGYMARGRGGSWAQCDADHPKAMPYFHRSHDRLIMSRPDAKSLCAMEAHAILDWHEAYAKRAAEGRTRRLEFQGRAFEPGTLSDGVRLRRAMAAELCGEVG